MIDAALRYAARGWRVFPVWPIRDGRCGCGKECGRDAGKHPMTVHGVKEATTDEAEIREAWAKVPDANIGIATGQGLLVVDVDPRNGGSLKTLLSYGDLHSCLQKTGGGGIHVLLKVPPELKWPSKLEQGIDLKSDGGYIVAAPSLHISGTAYEWIEGREGVEAAPQWLLARALPAIDVQINTSAGKTSPATLSVLHHAADWLKKHGPAVSGANGDSHTYKAGAYIFHDLGLTWEEGEPLIKAWNLSCEPPWDPGELKAKAYRETYARPEIQKGEARTFIRILDNLRGETSSVSQLTTDSRTIPTLFEPLPTFLARKYPKPPWLINGVLAEQSVTVLGGEPKVSKTWAGLELGLSLAAGKLAFGEFEVPAPRPVVFFLVEDDARSAANRIRSLAAGKGISHDALQHGHIRCRQALNIQDDKQLAQLIQAVTAIPEVAMIYLDPMRDLHLGDENSSADMADVMGRLRKLRDETNASVVFAHHTGKSSDSTKDRRPGQKLRGSGAIHGAIDSGLYLYGLDTDGQSYWSNSAEVEMKGFKGAGCFDVRLEVKDSPDGEAIWARWTFEKAEGAAERKILAAAAAAFPEELSRSALVELAHVNTGKGLKVIRSLISSGQLVETAHGKIRPKFV